MIPSIDTRLSSMVNAMTQVVAPAVTGNPFAAEQAALVAGHLQVLRAEEPISQEFEQLDFNRLRRYADRLTSSADGGAAVDEAVTHLRAELTGPVPFTIAEVRQAHDELARAVGGLIEAAGKDGTEQYVQQSQAIVLAEERENAIRYRAYFKTMGYETGAVEVPNADEMMTEFRAAHGPESEGAA